ncbi:hypothetical protein RhiirB3_385034 [Rhizophagus irregularis]|nr:hypothetical protein RhiirB3_385034 [Rhizophagus irregularis]
MSNIFDIYDIDQHHGTANDDGDNNFQPTEAANLSSTRDESGNSEINEFNPPSQYKVVPASRLRARASTTEVETSMKPPTRSITSKGKKLHDILLADSSFNGELIASEELKVSDISNDLNEMLKDDPVKIVDEKSAKDRIDQWRRQELQCENFVIAAESFNLLHLVSLVQIYDDLFELGEKLRTDPNNNIKTTKSWVIQFMRSVLKIGDKMEQRNRVGCDRLRRLFNEGITSTQLAKAGCRKCDFFVKQEYYEVFLSQVPTLETRRSISSLSNERLSEILSTANPDSTAQKKKRRVEFMGEEFINIADK